MSADVLLKMKNNGEWRTVAGLRVSAFSVNARHADVTDLPNEGARSASITGSGVFVDSEADEIVRAAFFDQVKSEWRIVNTHHGYIEGSFLVNALEYRGRQGGEASYSLSLASTGPVKASAPA